MSEEEEYPRITAVIKNLNDHERRLIADQMFNRLSYWTQGFLPETIDSSTKYYTFLKTRKADVIDNLIDLMDAHWRTHTKKGTMILARILSDDIETFRPSLKLDLFYDAMAELTDATTEE